MIIKLILIGKKPRSSRKRGHLMAESCTCPGLEEKRALLFLESGPFRGRGSSWSIKIRLPKIVMSSKCLHLTLRSWVITVWVICANHKLIIAYLKMLICGTLEAVCSCSETKFKGRWWMLIFKALGWVSEVRSVMSFDGIVWDLNVRPLVKTKWLICPPRPLLEHEENWHLERDYADRYI